MTGVTVTIEPLSDEILAAYAASGMERGKAGRGALEWVFEGNATPFAVARHGHEIIGLSAYIKSRMSLGGSEAVALQAVDSFVSDKARGKGVFTGLARAYDQHAQQEGADLVWGFPNANAAPVWFGKLNWSQMGQVPFLIKPLRAGFFLRKLRLSFDFPLSFTADQNLQPVSTFGGWADELWSSLSRTVVCGNMRDSAFLTHRLIDAPMARSYRVVADERDGGAIVATTEAVKHGGRIGYLLEAMGHRELDGLLASEMRRLRDRGVEVVLAWSYPWSANYRSLRKAGFFHLPERVRPIQIWFGSRPLSPIAVAAEETKNWYLSYLDSDTI